jgi:hypothetical protein
MASTYSTLKIELIGTGEQSGTWGTTTNTNLGTALEEAIVGSADVPFSSADVTLTLTDVNTTQAARHVRLNLTGTSGGARNLILGSGCQIDKPYLINNGLADTVTVKNTTGTGIAVPAGKTMWVYNNGTNVVDAVTHLTSLTLGSALPVASGGSGQTSYTDGQLLIGNTSGNTLAKATLTAGTGIAVTNGAGTISIAATNNGTVTSVSGTGNVNGITLTGTVTSTGNLTLGGTLSNVSLTTQVTGTLPVANGGTGITSFGTGVATWLGTPSSANLAAAVTDETGSGSLVFATSPTLVTPVLGTPTSGNLSNCTVDGTDAVGFRNIPQNSQSAAYTLVLADAGKHIFHPASDNNTRTFTIPANSSVAFPTGTAITFINMSVANVTIAITTDTLILSPAGTTGSRTLATNGSATCIKITSTEWLISGSGLT